MPRSLSIAAALATVLTVTACGSVQAGTASGPEDAPPPAAGSAPQPAEAGQAAEQGGGDASMLSAEAPAALQLGEPGLPAHSGASVDDVLRLGAVASWVEAPDVLAISLPATGDCWPSATDPVALSPTQLEIVFAPVGCESFDTARTYTFDVPDGIDRGVELEVAIAGLLHEFTLTLPGR